MFNYVNIDLSMLPCTKEERDDIELAGDYSFQTKSFQWPTLSTYDISQPIKPGDCQLFRTSNDWREPVEERVECEPMKFTGLVTFYGDGASGHWYEFDALFADGVLLKIERNKEREELFSNLV